MASFDGLITSTVAFSSAPGSSLEQDVFFSLSDDLVALEEVEVVVLSLNISGAVMTRLGDPPTTLIHILDNDGML